MNRDNPPLAIPPVIQGLVRGDARPTIGNGSDSAREDARPTPKRWLWWVIAAIAGGGGMITLFLFDPARVPIYPVCMFRSATGLDCPGCGGLRATHQLLHGEWLAAFQLNPLFVLMLPVVLMLFARAAWLRRKHERVELVRPAWLWVFCVVLIVFGVFRNLNSAFPN